MKYFTIKELSQTSVSQDNHPGLKETENLKLLVEKVLDPLREMYGKSIHVNSGFRNPIVNRKVKGALNSDHLYGYAADITGGSKEENKKLYELIKTKLTYKQLINEYDYSWIHVSYDKNNLKKENLIVK